MTLYFKHSPNKKGFALPGALFALALGTLCTVAILRLVSLEQHYALIKLKNERLISSALTALSANGDKPHSIIPLPNPYKQISINAGTAETTFNKHEAALFATIPSVLTTPHWKTLVTNLPEFHCSKTTEAMPSSQFASAKNCQETNFALENSAIIYGNLDVTGVFLVPKNTSDASRILAVVGSVKIDSLDIKEHSNVHVLAIGEVVIDKFIGIENIINNSAIKNSVHLHIHSSSSSIVIPDEVSTTLQNCTEPSGITLEAAQGIYTKSGGLFSPISLGCQLSTDWPKFKVIARDYY